MKLEPILLKRPLFRGSPDDHVKAVLKDLADGAKADFEQTTATWQHKPVFAVTVSAREATVATDDEVYGYVDQGTAPHLIVAHGKALAIGIGSTPKTRPRVIGSGAGSRGTTIYRPFVRHPGTDAREFSQTIAQKWERIAPAKAQAILRRYYR